MIHTSKSGSTTAVCTWTTYELRPALMPPSPRRRHFPALGTQGGGCAYSNCGDGPSCPGGACSFENCDRPSCRGEKASTVCTTSSIGTRAAGNSRGRVRICNCRQLDMCALVEGIVSRNQPNSTKYLLYILAFLSWFYNNIYIIFLLFVLILQALPKRSVFMVTCNEWILQVGSRWAAYW